MSLVPTFRQAMLPLVDQLQALTGPTGFDVQTIRLTIRTRVWSGGRNGLGTAVNTDLVLPQIYDVVHLTEKQIASSGGRYEIGDMKVGPITPAYGASSGIPAGGFTPAQLKPAGADGTEIVYVLAGAVNGEYACIELHTEEAFEYYLVIGRKRTTP